MPRLAEIKVERGGWYYGPWVSPAKRRAAEERWKARSYEFRADEEYQCGGCRWFAAAGYDYGICANADSPLDGRITFEHGGCAEHSEIRR